MTTPKEALELKPCPFCGATPHRGLGKVYHDQLHGEPHQDFSIWCPKGHAKITGVNAALAADEWNTRALASLQGEDAVERVARIMDLVEALLQADCEFEQATPGNDQPAYENLKAARAELEGSLTTLATGLVPDEAAIRADAIDPADLWDRYCDETDDKSRTPQGAMAFAVAAIRSGGGE